MLRFTRTRLRRFPASLCLALATTALAFAHDAGAERPGGRGEDKPALEWVEDLKSPTQGTRTRATVAAELYRGGYRLVEKDRRFEIKRRQSS